MASERLELARQLIRQGREAEALAAVESVVRADASNVEALMLISKLYGSLGKHQFSLQAALRAAQLAPESVEAMLCLARAYHHLGDMEKCDRCLSVAVSRDPAWLRAQFFQQIKAAGDVDENSLPGRVVLVFDQVAEQPDALPFVAYNLGRLLLALGARHAARQAYERACEQDPEMAEAFAGVGELEFMEGRFEQCLEWFDEARRCRWVKTKTDLLFDREQMTQSVAAGDMTQGQVDRYAARALARLGRFIEANRMMQSAIEWQPWDIDSVRRDIVGEYLAVGQAIQAQQGLEAAIKIWEAAQETARQANAHELFLQLGRAYLQMAAQAYDQKDRHQMAMWLERARNLVDAPPAAIPPEAAPAWDELRAAVKQARGRGSGRLERLL